MRATWAETGGSAGRDVGAGDLTTTSSTRRRLRPCPPPRPSHVQCPSWNTAKEPKAGVSRTFA
jgi:hypothetical protein